MLQKLEYINRKENNCMNTSSDKLAGLRTRRYGQSEEGETAREKTNFLQYKIMPLEPISPKLKCTIRKRVEW